jgi:hypothetical protein
LGFHRLFVCILVVLAVVVGNLSISPSFALAQGVTTVAEVLPASQVPAVSGATSPPSTTAPVPGQHVRGRIVDISGQAISGAYILAEPLDGGTATSTSSDVSGIFTLTLAEQKYGLRFSKVGYVSHCLDSSNLLGACGTVDLTGNDGRDLGDVSLSRYGTLSGLVRDDTGKPVPSAYVSAVSASGASLASGFTDAAGAYALTGLPAGNYSIRFSKSGLLSLYYPASPTLLGATPVSVGLDQEIKGIDATLATGGSLTGTVTDASDTPLDGILISATPVNGSAGPVFARTDSSGNYTLKGLSSGSFVVWLGETNTDYIVQTYPKGPVQVQLGRQTALEPVRLTVGGTISGRVENVASSTDVARVTLVPILPCPATNVSVLTDLDGAYTIRGLPSCSYSMTIALLGFLKKTDTPLTVNVASLATKDLSHDVDLTLGGEIQGFVGDKSAQALSNVWVSAQSIPSVSPNCSVKTAYALSDENGQFKVRGLDTCTYQLTLTYGTMKYVSPQIPVVQGDTVTAPGVTLKAAGGQVSGTVNTTSNQPLAGVSVTATPKSGQSTWNSVTTGADGTYLMEGLEPGTYLFTFAAPGTPYVSASKAVTLLTGGDVPTDQSAQLHIGGSISGKVMGQSDSGDFLVGGVSVLAIPTSGSSPSVSAVTNSQGEFTIQGLDTGSYVLEVSPKGAPFPRFMTQFYRVPGLDGYPVVTTRESATVLNLTLGQTLLNNNIRLAVGASIGGKVYDGKKIPMEGAKILAQPGPNCGLDSATAYSAKDGSFELTGLSPCSYSLTVTKSDYVPATISVPVLTLGVVSRVQDVVLNLGGTLQGAVTDAGGKRLERVSVLATPGISCLGSISLVAYTDSTGNYRVSGLDKCTYAVRFVKQGFVEQSTQISIDNASTNSVDISLQNGTEIKGAVNAASTALPISGVYVRAVSQKTAPGTVVQSTWTDANGNYSITGLGTGTYNLIFSAPTPEFVGANREVVVTGPGQTLEQNVSLQVGAQISGKVKYFDQGTKTLVGLGGAIIIATPDGKTSSCPSEALYAISDKLGSYVVKGLPPCTYALTIGKDAFLPDSTTLPKVTIDKVSDVKSVSDVVLQPVRVFTTMPVPTITGTVAVGATVTAVTGVWLPAPVSLSYQWKRAGVVIAGATNASYAVTGTDFGKTLTVDVTGVKAGYQSVTKSSVPTSSVLGAALTASPVPTITGVVQVGATLTAAAGVWLPAPVSVSYQWKRAGLAIEGATSSSYVLTAVDAGKTITVEVTGVKAGYVSVTKASSATVVVASAVFTTVPVPIVSGVSTVGRTLSATAGVQVPAADSVSYVWKRAGVVIAGATSSSYVLTAVDAGKTITVETTAVKAGYVSVTKASSATAVVVSPLTATPVPTITGTVAVGATLTAVTGVWAPAVNPFAYQWKRAGVVIAGATNSSYVLTAADLGKTITVDVTGSKTGFESVTMTSAATLAVVR